MLIEAHRRAPASVLAPFIYTQIIPMIIIGFLVFGDVPDPGPSLVVWWLLRAAFMCSTASAGLPGARRPRGGRP